MIISIMPLAFKSLSHGEVAYGFFNIETDMLLLDRHFFFAGDFCAAIDTLAASAGDTSATAKVNAAYTLDPASIGNLMGAIHGYNFTGFIGEVYKRFPFPANQDKFHQQPEGNQAREIIEMIIGKYAAAHPITVTSDPRQDKAAIGGYVFDRREFHRLVLYVWVGGYPRWRDGIRPDYVAKMKHAIKSSHSTFFRDFNFEEKRIPGLG